MHPAVAGHTEVFFQFDALAIEQNTAVVVAQLGYGMAVEERAVIQAEDRRLRHAVEFGDLAVGVLVAPLAILDVDAGFDGVENGVQALFAGL